MNMQQDKTIQNVSVNKRWWKGRISHDAWQDVFYWTLNAAVFCWFKRWQDRLGSVVIEGARIVRYTTWWKYCFPGYIRMYQSDQVKWYKCLYSLDVLEVSRLRSSEKGSNRNDPVAAIRTDALSDQVTSSVLCEPRRSTCLFQNAYISCSTSNFRKVDLESGRSVRSDEFGASCLYHHFWSFKSVRIFCRIGWHLASWQIFM
jgi:hypothetical protein